MALNKADPSVILTSFYNCTELFTYIEKPGDLPDVIFLDLNIPGNENFEAVKRLITFFTTVPVIIYSTSNAQRDMDNALCYGASAYLVKPGNIQLLEKTLKQLIESYSAEEPPISDN
jgi:CheY-like chemotaxis protein